MLIRSFCVAFILAASVAAFAQQLPYGVRDDVKRQTQNMAEIEQELSQLVAQVKAGPSPQQQALLAQFQTMLTPTHSSKRSLRLRALRSRLPLWRKWVLLPVRARAK